MNDVIKCPSCGRELHENAQYCMYCMTSLYPKDDITPETSAKRRWVVAGTAVLTVVLMLGFMVCIYFGIQYLSIDDAPKTEYEQGHEESIILDTEGKNTEDAMNTQPFHSVEDAKAPIPVDPSSTGQENIPQPVKPTNPAIQHQTESTPKTENSVITEPTKKPAANTTTEPTQKPETNTSTEPTKQTQNTQLQSCNHSYKTATCIAPMTCTICGDTVGTVNTSAHVWKAITAVVHHEEVGHYEIVDEYYKKTIYLCFFDGYNQEGFESLEELRNHMPVHSNKTDYDYVISVPDMLADTREIWATRPVQQWVVDQKAYDETVVTGYICTVCNAKKDP